jgi:7,8-dihydropterin-6-yl-methyl-4-(beta-D-ribofuranosyl)aminobenzene 5'-phosphate synthase
MKLTVLIDNNTYIDEYYIGEPALSYYIEDENERLLFDAGYSDAFIRNAQAMNIDLIHKSIPVHEVGVGLK